MYEWIKLFFNIALLKKGPQDIPYTQGLLFRLILLYSVVSFLVLRINETFSDSLLQILLGVFLILAFGKVLLFFWGKPERFEQTVCALLGVDAVISFLALPSIATMASGHITILSLFILVLFIVWHWLASGHIFRHALTQSLLFGLGVSFLYLLASYQLVGLLFPEAPPATL